jgi:hypothetical protein
MENNFNSFIVGYLLENSNKLDCKLSEVAVIASCYDYIDSVDIYYPGLLIYLNNLKDIYKEKDYKNLDNTIKDILLILRNSY